MRVARIVSSSVVVGFSIAAAAFACGGDDGGGGGGNPDAMVVMDMQQLPPDAAPAMGIGQPCTPPMTGVGQGDCPDGYTCLKLGETAAAWCSKPCMRGSADQCRVGYTGPGFAACIWDVMFVGGDEETTVPYCGVVCADSSGMCGSACSNTCPGTQTCSYNIMIGSAAGSACF